jgi:hypothetical protein
MLVVVTLETSRITSSYYFIDPCPASIRHILIDLVSITAADDALKNDGL